MFAGDPDPARVAAAQHVLNTLGARAALVVVAGLQTAQRAYRLVQIGCDPGQHVRDRAGVGGEDLHPHPGVGGGDPGHVPDALAAEAYGGLVGLLQPGGDHRRDQLRGVGNESDGPVVGVGVHDDRDGAAERDQFQGEVEDLGVGVTGRSEDPGAALEEIRGGGEGAGPLLARPSGAYRCTGRGRCHGLPVRGAGRP